MMHVLGMWLHRTEKQHSVLNGKSEGKRHSVDLNVDGTVIKMALK
jgi:hypothetical protein